MREHLFKAKTTDTKKWVKGYLVKYPSAIQIGDNSPWYISKPPYDPDDKGELYNVDPETVCEYTEQTDKEANKIFENDLVIWPVEDYCEGTVFKVEWDSDNCRFWATTLDDKYSESFDSFFAEHCKVIGNIHDKEEK